jgi:glycosyltransferase involved in cell wall biosynthesis
MSSRRLLVSAYGCEPGKGSEQGVGWNWILQLAELAELVVITRSNNRKAIEAGLPEEFSGRIRFVYYDLPDRLRSFKRKERGFYLYYLMWQWGAYRLMLPELKKQPFDYAMHLTFGSVWLPTFMHRLPVPFIWGPVGGGEAVPWGLISSLPLKDRFVQYARYLLMKTFAVNPLVSSVPRKARVILARTEDTARIFQSRHGAKIRVVLETAAADYLFNTRTSASKPIDSKPLEVIYTGRLVAFKNVEMAIRAVAEARRRGKNIHFTVVGDGPLKSSLHKLATELGIAGAISFTGFVTQEDVMKQLAKSHLYLFPSLREGGPWSLMEAMAIGLPSICVNTSGMKVIADDTCARLVQPGRPSEMVMAFADTLCDLDDNPELRREMGAHARRRLQQEFSWPQKCTFMAALLEDLDRGVL